MRSRIGIIVLSAFVLSGYTRCDPLEPPANPVFVNLQSEQICMRGNYSSISRDRWENVVTGAILTNREYQRIPDVDVSLEPGQCFVLPDCAGADPVGLGYFRDSGFNFIDPTPRLLFDLGVRSRDIGGAGFAYLFYDPFTQQYLGTSANLNQRAYLSELPQDSTIGGEDKLVLCARDDAPPTDTALRGWVMVGQTPDDRELNPFAANDGYAVIRYIVDILEASPPPPDPPLVVTLDDGDIGYTVTRDTPIEAVAAITGAAADSTVRCEWAITDAQNPDGLLLIADPGACSASLSLNPDALPENGVLIDFRVTAREFDVDDNQLDVASDASVAIASVQIVSEPVLDLATPVTLYTANGREQILTAEVSGIGDDAARVACGWSAATLQIMPPDGVMI